MSFIPFDKQGAIDNDMWTGQTPEGFKSTAFQYASAAPKYKSWKKIQYGLQQWLPHVSEIFLLTIIAQF